VVTVTDAYGYFVELDEDTEDTSWFLAIPYGEYDHPTYGTLDFNRDKVQGFAQSVKDKVRDADLDINYDHREHSGEAAGWVKDATAGDDGLWLQVEWTKQAAQKIRDRAYRYFSPEFLPTWTHPKTKVKHSDVLFGGSLTNRPHLRDLPALTLHEKTETVEHWPPTVPTFPPPIFSSDEIASLIASVNAGGSTESYRARLGNLIEFDRLIELAKNPDELTELCEVYPESYERYRRAYLRGEK
jgi:Mu-like prophage I protein